MNSIINKVVSTCTFSTKLCPVQMYFQKLKKKNWFIDIHVGPVVDTCFQNGNS